MCPLRGNRTRGLAPFVGIGEASFRAEPMTGRPFNPGRRLHRKSLKVRPLLYQSLGRFRFGSRVCYGTHALRKLFARPVGQSKQLVFEPGTR
jgi:hypothetical protein